MKLVQHNIVIFMKSISTAQHCYFNKWVHLNIVTSMNQYSLTVLLSWIKLVQLNIVTFMNEISTAQRYFNELN